MIEIYKYYSNCNQAINAKMINILEGLDFNIYDPKMDGYFKSIGEILDHYYTGDMKWLNSFSTVKEYSIFKHQEFKSIPNFGDQLFHSISEYKDSRANLDEIIIELVDEIKVADLDKIVTRLNRLGQKQEKVFWKCLVHMFNHQTHHRGQISQILDQLKVENDYSNMILY